jgi:hypothetical protein
MEMNNINYNSQLQSGFSVQFVQREYFIERALELQEKYKLQWGGWYEFLEVYKNHASSIDSSNFELDEWAFLCEEFMADLIQLEFHADGDEPPGKSSEADSQRPEINSGLCFGATKCLIRRSTLPAYRRQ